MFTTGVHAAPSETAAPAPNATEPSREYQIKAAFLYNFTRYVKWPASAFEDKRSPIVVAVVGKDPFGTALEKAFAGKTAAGRKIVVRRFRSTATLGKCHLLFVPSGEADSLPIVAKHYARSAVLIVGESKEFASRGGQINFYIENKKVHFEINVDAVDRAELGISSQLLKLARIVKDKQ